MYLTSEIVKFAGGRPPYPLIFHQKFGLIYLYAIEDPVHLQTNLGGMFWKVPLVSFTRKQLNSKTTVIFYVFTRTQWNSLGRAVLMSYASQDALKHNPTANTDFCQ